MDPFELPQDITALNHDDQMSLLESAVAAFDAKPAPVDGELG